MLLCESEVCDLADEYKLGWILMYEGDRLNLIEFAAALIAENERRKNEKTQEKNA
jgi:hypothetical protein